MLCRNSIRSYGMLPLLASFAAPRTAAVPTDYSSADTASLLAMNLAAENGLLPTQPINLACDQKVVHWKEVDLDYTFLVFCLRKSANWPCMMVAYRRKRSCRGPSYLAGHNLSLRYKPSGSIRPLAESLRICL